MTNINGKLNFKLKIRRVAIFLVFIMLFTVFNSGVSTVFADSNADNIVVMKGAFDKSLKVRGKYWIKVKVNYNKQTQKIESVEDNGTYDVCIPFVGKDKDNESDYEQGRNAELAAWEKIIINENGFDKFKDKTFEEVKEMEPQAEPDRRRVSEEEYLPYAVKQAVLSAETLVKDMEVVTMKGKYEVKSPQKYWVRVKVECDPETLQIKKVADRDTEKNVLKTNNSEIKAEWEKFKQEKGFEKYEGKRFDELGDIEDIEGAENISKAIKRAVEEAEVNGRAKKEALEKIEALQKTENTYVGDGQEFFKVLMKDLKARIEEMDARTPINQKMKEILEWQLPRLTNREHKAKALALVGKIDNIGQVEEDAKEDYICEIRNEYNKMNPPEKKLVDNPESVKRNSPKNYKKLTDAEEALFKLKYEGEENKANVHIQNVEAPIDHRDFGYVMKLKIYISSKSGKIVKIDGDETIKEIRKSREKYYVEHNTEHWNEDFLANGGLYNYLGKTKDTFAEVDTISHATLCSDSAKNAVRKAFANIYGEENVGGIAGIAPSITRNPENEQVTVGDTVSFTVAASGNPQPTYQWQVKIGAADWSNIDSATADTYTISPASLEMNGNQYRCIITNSLGNAATKEVLLTVNKKSQNAPEKPELDRKTRNPAITKLSPLAVDGNGKATITKDVISKAVTNAKAGEKDGREIVVTVDIETGTAPDTVKMNLSADALTELISSGIHRFVLNTDKLIDLSFKVETLKELKSRTSGDIVLSVSKGEVTSSDAKTAIGKRPVYDISILYRQSGQETKISNLNKNEVSVSIPYTISGSEKSKNLYAVYVDEKGSVEWLTKSSYDADRKAVIFETNHFSVYGVGYKQSIPEFKDIDSHWAKEDILYVAGRGMLTGTGSNAFSPDVKITRGMFVTMLGRLAGIDPDKYTESKFKDVKANAYYTPYVNWAVEKGIVKGTSKDTFSPDSNITREQMAATMKRYSEKMGYTLPQKAEEMKFADEQVISSWAGGAVKEMQRSGILSGKRDNIFDPKGEATRAEASAVLHRFVEIVIE